MGERLRSYVRYGGRVFCSTIDSSGTLPGLVLALCAVGTGAGPAQTPQSPSVSVVPAPAWAYNDLACAPYMTFAAPTSQLNVIGSQDTSVKRMLGPGDTLVINGGTATGLQPGAQYYVRRLARRFDARSPDRDHPLIVHTAGWLRVLGVSANIATATLVHACEGVLVGDYLEPFEPPVVATEASMAGTPEFSNMGRVLQGDDARQLAGVGELIVIDRGANHGIRLGQRLAIYRDKRLGLMSKDDPGRGLLPMVAIGEVVAVAVRPETSTVQVSAARDAVASGDLVAIVR